MAALAVQVVPAFADPVTLYGLQFPVDDLVTIDDASVKVTLAGETQIVQRVNLSNFVVQKSFQTPDIARRFSITSIDNFIEGALSDHDVSRTVWGIQGLLARADVNADAVNEKLFALSDRPEAAPAVQTVLSQPAIAVVSEETRARMMVGVGMSNPEWLQSQYLSADARIQGLIREMLRQRSLAALRSHEFSKVDRLISMQRGMIGESDPVTRDLTILVSRLREALDRASRGEIEPLFAIAEVSKGSRDAAELVSPFIIDAVHQQAADNLQRGETTKALLLLSRLEFDRRTPKTRELTMQALGQVSGSVETPLANSLVDQFLRRFAEADSAVKQAYIIALDKQIRLLFQSGRVDLAGDYVGRLSRVRPDPNSENDSIRVLQALAFLNRGMRASANQTMSEIQTGISPVERLELAWSGYYGDPLTLVLVLLIPSIAGLLIWIRNRASILLGTDEQPAAPKEEEEEDDSDRPSGFAITGSRLMSPSMQEYNRSLQALGLKPGASLRQIKSHYRNLIKKVHPDLNENLSAAEKEHFVTLTKTYDRLMELRRELKFPES